mgnify:CR=1 FL=1
MMDKAMQAYIDESNAWEVEVYQRAQARAKLWGVVAIVAIVFAGLCLCAVMMLIPLKTVEPYVIRVDKASGLVDVVQPLSEGSISENEAMVKYFVKMYITAREGYLYDRYKADYEIVQKMSTNTVATDYHSWFHPSNEHSPLNTLARKGSVNITVRNLSFLDDDTVSVPILRETKNGSQSADTYDVITLSFQFTQTPQSERDRLINPLGFQVTAYRVDEQMIQSKD